MKITKRQLRQIIKEEKAKLQEYGGRPYDPTVPGDQQLQADLLNPTPMSDDEALFDDYREWVKETGQITPAASSVIATYLVEQGLTSEQYHRLLGDEFGVDPVDIESDIKRQQKEYDAGGALSDEQDYERGFKEGKMPDVWLRILGNSLEK
jgi:hypothetical protein